MMSKAELARKAGVSTLTIDRVDTLLVPDGDPTLERLDDAWTLEAAERGYQLWRRAEPPDGGYPEPLP